MKEKMSLGKQLKRERESRGLSIEYVAKSSILSIKRISDYESGKTRPSSKTFCSIMEVFERYDADLSKSKDIEESISSFSDMSYLDCCNELCKISEAVKNSIRDETFDCFVNSCNSLKDITESIKLLFNRSIVLTGYLDKNLVLYTINKTLEYLMQARKDVFHSYRPFMKKLPKEYLGNDDIGKIISHLMDSLHNIDYIFSYLNDYFNLLYGVRLLKESDSGNIVSYVNSREVRLILNAM